jgi:hypothetical protein
MITTFISNRYEYDELTQFFPRFNFYSQALMARTTPLFVTFCLQIYFQYYFFISLLFHLFFLF